MKIIYVDSPKYGRKEILVDDEDYEWLNKFSWYIHKPPIGRTFYAIHYDSKTKQYIRMHRMILGLNHGDKRHGDHIDHNGLNNQRYNIRIATHQQNICNVQKRRTNTSSKFKGVYSCPSKTNKWKACIYNNNITYYLGRFKTEEEAALAYDKKAKELHSEFCYLNFP